MRSLKSASGSRIRVISVSGPSALGAHSFLRFMIPFGTWMKPRRIGRAVSADRAGVMASSTGNASTAPAPRKKVRRGIYFLVITIAYPPHLERGAVDDPKNDG
jgi:hypothetical protein